MNDPFRRRDRKALNPTATAGVNYVCGHLDLTP